MEVIKSYTWKDLRSDWRLVTPRLFHKHDAGSTQLVAATFDSKKDAYSYLIDLEKAGYIVSSLILVEMVSVVPF